MAFGFFNNPALIKYSLTMALPIHAGVGSYCLNPGKMTKIIKKMYKITKPAGDKPGLRTK
ncbi:unnamed protein product [marine sediment metagenome]|uniref:Uncharacterized protein n=1 Tax=marine sediment metagenome TaxID=412755 RepID=X1BSI0_9ZZZZ